MWPALFSAGASILGSKLFEKNKTAGNLSELASTGSKVMDAYGKIKGIPTPKTEDPESAGLRTRAYLKTAFPGTGVWEQLRSGQGYAAASAAVNEFSNARYLAKMQQANEREIADKNNKAHLLAAGAPYGNDALDELTARYEGKKATKYDNPQNISREALNNATKKLESEIQNLNAQTKQHIEQSIKTAQETINEQIRKGILENEKDITEATAKLAPETAKEALQGQKITNWKNIVSIFTDAIQSVGIGAFGVKTALSSGMRSSHESIIRSLYKRQ